MTDPVPEITRLQNATDDKDLQDLQYLRLHIAQLELRVAELRIHAQSVNRPLKYITGAAVVVAAAVCCIAWMLR